MDFSSSQGASFFDSPEEILKDERTWQEDCSIDSPHSDSINPLRPASSKGESEPPYQAEQVPTMRFLSFSTEKSYVMVKAFMEDFNKTASCQDYNVVIKRGNKKDKNSDSRKVKLDYTKGGEYKENVGEVGEVGQGGRQRKRQSTGCPFKAYA